MSLRDGHTETLDCPCRPEVRLAVGGGRVRVHRALGLDDGRPTYIDRALDRLCRVCPGNVFHFVGHPHLVAA